ncbi:MAG TPA: bifunctional DNA-formamidopyrimidine glycosylase/DNA-(apurinic or apyrimidinic site) lyase [Ktedonobacterales bacterium]|nr:bifunctional DNA-formamidopyrimidine glycosylase/DNA-(apurinic or apyrimidinic site) lyase [Ktedonobacterales bacterium]
MPELPEVEYVARQLRAALVGRAIVAVEVSWARAISVPAVEAFRTAVRGRRVAAVSRRAKHLLIALDAGETLVIHRRMTGNLTLVPAGVEPLYTRVRFTLDDGRDLVFSDPRKFGRIALLAPAELQAMLAALGPEPLEEEFTPEVLAERLAGRERGLKALLLDQAVIAGLGNIYADEALFRARLHPLRAGASLAPAEVAALRWGIRDALRTGLEHGGTTIGRHRDAYDEAGTNLDHLDVYRRTGQPCRRCGTAIARILVAQRGTHFCPRCQPAEPS